MFPRIVTAVVVVALASRAVPTLHANAVALDALRALAGRAPRGFFAMARSSEEIALVGAAAGARGDHARAIDRLQAASIGPSPRPIWFLLLAASYMQTNDFEHAAASIRRASAGERAVIERCHEALYSRIDARQAASWCPLLADVGNGAEAQCLVGEHYARSGDSRAADWFTRATREAPGPECLHDFARFLTAQGRFTEALSVTARAQSLSALPRYVRAEGDVYALMPDPVRALAAYDRALTLSPSGAEGALAFAGKGTVYFYALGDHARAAAEFRSAIRLDPPIDVSVYWLLARSERSQGRSEDALLAYRTVARRLAGGAYLADWRREHAAYLQQLGRNREAVEAYRAILRDVPDDAASRKALEALGSQP